MKTLYFRIDESWPSSPICDWVLVDRGHHIIQQGSSDPATWPAADQNCAVIAGCALTLNRVELPEISRREREQALRYALEERLACDLEKVHLTPLVWSSRGALAAVTDRSRLDSLVQTMSALGRPLSSAIALLELLPEEGWTLANVDGRWYLRREDGSGLCLGEADAGSPPPLLDVALHEARRAGGAPRSIQIIDMGAPASDIDWPLPSSTVAGSTWPLTRNATSLLHGVLKPASGNIDWRATLRPAMLLVGASLVIHLLASIFDLVSQQRQLADVRQQVRSIFASQFPQAAIVDPGLQMQRQLNLLRGQRGALQDSDFLVLSAALSGALGPDAGDTLQRMNYGPDGLEVELRLPPGLSTEVLRDRLMLQAIDASNVGDPPAPGVWHAVLRRRSA